MTIDDDIQRALAGRQARSGAKAPTLAEIEDAASSDVVLVADDGGSAHSDRVRPVRIGVAAAVVIAVVVAAGLVIGNREEDAVVAGPGTDHVTWKDAPLLAPNDVDWYITGWDPNLPPADVEKSNVGVSGVGFRSHDITWSMVVQHIKGDAGTGRQESEGTTTTKTDRTIAGRSVTISETTSDAATADPALPSSVGTGMNWTEGSFEVSIFGSSEATTPVINGTPITDPNVAGPQHISPDVIDAVVSSIQPVSFETWSAALHPPDGVTAPEALGGGVIEGLDRRPVRLGTPTSAGRSELWLSPWIQSLTSIRLADSGEPVALSVTTNGDPGAQWIESDRSDTTGEPLVVRGTEGWRDRWVDGTFQTPLFGGDAPRKASKAISWSEGGSKVALLYPDQVSDDDALTLANSLEILDDTQWDALLFPAVEDDTPGTATTSTTSDPGSPNNEAMPVAGSCGDRKMADVLPLLAPDGVDWHTAFYAAPADHSAQSSETVDFNRGSASYTIGFEMDGREWELDVEQDNGALVPRGDGEQVVIGDRTVTIVRPPGSDRVTRAVWSERPGVRVVLADYGINPSSNGSGMQGVDEYIAREGPDEIQLRNALGALREVPAAEWAAVVAEDILPATIDEAVAAPTGQCRGLYLWAADTLTMTMYVESPILPGTEVDVRTGEPDSTSLPGVAGTPVEVQGGPGVLTRIPEGSVAATPMLQESSPGGMSRNNDVIVSWGEPETGPDLVGHYSVTDAQAIAIADSLVTATREQWMTLLGL